MRDQLELPGSRGVRLAVGGAEGAEKLTEKTQDKTEQIAPELLFRSALRLSLLALLCLARLKMLSAG